MHLTSYNRTYAGTYSFYYNNLLKYAYLDIIDVMIIMVIICHGIIISTKKKSSYTYPLRTPRTRLSIKNDPNIIRGTKYIQLNPEPIASLV